MDFRALAAVVENNLWGYSEYKIGMAAPLATSEAAALRELAAAPRMARGNGTLQLGGSKAASLERSLFECDAVADELAAERELYIEPHLAGLLRLP